MPIEKSIAHWHKGNVPYREFAEFFRKGRPKFALGEMWGKFVRSGAMQYRHRRDPELKPIIEKLDYFLGSYWGEGIYVDADAEDVFVSTAPGGSEGVYIDGYLGIYREDDGEMEKIQFLTVKTLEEGYDALLDMSRLSGAIQYAGDRFLWINNDLITAK